MFFYEAKLNILFVESDYLSLIDILIYAFAKILLKLFTYMFSEYLNFKVV